MIVLHWRWWLDCGNVAGRPCLPWVLLSTDSLFMRNHTHAHCSCNIPGRCSVTNAGLHTLWVYQCTSLRLPSCAAHAVLLHPGG